MKRKWIILGVGLSGLLFVAGAGGLWLAIVTFSKVSSLAQDKIVSLQAMTHVQCVEAARSLFNSDAWISNPPRQNIRILRDACSLEEQKNVPINEEAIKLRTIASEMRPS